MHFGLATAFRGANYRKYGNQKLEQFNINVGLAIIGVIKDTTKKKMYQKLDLESDQRRWYRKLCLFFKIFESKSAGFLFRCIPSLRRPYRTRYCNNMTTSIIIFL